MNQKIILLLAALAILCLGCKKTEPAQPQKAQVLVRWHFIGTSKIGANTNAHWFNRIAALPASAEFRDELLQKLARGPHQFLKYRIGHTTNDYAELIKPLLAELVRAESMAELRAVSNQPFEFVLAIELPDQQAKLWQSNIAFILKMWTACEPESLQGHESAGWQLKKHHAPNLIRFERVGDWVIFGWGHDTLTLFAEYAELIRKNSRPTPVELQTNKQTILECFIDWPKLQNSLEQQFGTELPVCLPTTHLTVASLNEEILTRASFDFPEPLNWSAAPWRIPTNTIREPLISFTACRGVAPLLQRFDLLNEIGFTPMPDQLYVWALQDVPFQTFLAAPALDTTNLIKRLGTVLRERLVPALEKLSLGNIEPDNEGNISLVWRGLPFISPYILSVTEPAGEFLLLGLFPNTPLTNPPPPELYAQFIDRPEIAYYDWEITQVRFHQLWNLCQLIRLIAGKPQLNTQTAMWKWLDSVSTNLGNTATHITVNNPQQLTLVRRSQLGLSAIELVAFANWLDSPGFPCCVFTLPARTESTAGRSHNANSNAQTRR